MFGWGKKDPSSASSNVYANNRHNLELARQAGDKKHEIILSIVALADDVMKMQAAKNRINALFDDGLDDLLEDSCFYFPTDLSVKLGNLRQYFDCIDSEVDEASLETFALVKMVTAHIKT